MASVPQVGRHRQSSLGVVHSPTACLAVTPTAICRVAGRPVDRTGHRPRAPTRRPPLRLVHVGHSRQSCRSEHEIPLPLRGTAVTAPAQNGRPATAPRSRYRRPAFVVSSPARPPVSWFAAHGRTAGEHGRGAPPSPALRRRPVATSPALPTALSAAPRHRPSGTTSGSSRYVSTVIQCPPNGHADIPGSSAITSDEEATTLRQWRLPVHEGDACVERLGNAQERLGYGVRRAALKAGAPARHRPRTGGR